MPQNDTTEVYKTGLTRCIVDLLAYNNKFYCVLPKGPIPELSENDCENIISGKFNGSTDYNIANTLSRFSKNTNIWKVPENLNEEDKKSYIVDRNNEILKHINKWIYLIGSGSKNYTYSGELKVLESYKKTLEEKIK